MANSAQDAIVAIVDSDPVTNVLKWILLITAIISFIIVGWGRYSIKIFEEQPAKSG